MGTAVKGKAAANIVMKAQREQGPEKVGWMVWRAWRTPDHPAQRAGARHEAGPVV